MNLNGQEIVINEVVKEHAVAIQDWEFHATVEFLHEWAERFNQELGLGIDTPAIQIKRERRRALGTYRYGFNGFGLLHEITLNTRHLHRSKADCLRTLLHEQLHQWQDQYGKPGRGNYHNKQFREKAASFGLIVDEKGCSLGVLPGPFTELLQEYGVDTSPLKPPEGQDRIKPRGDSKLKKWSCGCTNVRCATQLTARCDRCGNLFQRAEPAW